MHKLHPGVVQITLNDDAGQGLYIGIYIFTATIAVGDMLQQQFG